MKRPFCDGGRRLLPSSPPRGRSPACQTTLDYILTRPPAPLCSALCCFTGIGPPPHVLHTACSARGPAVWPYIFRMTALIYGMELLAMAPLFYDRAASPRGACFWIYLVRNNCMAALVRGDSNTGVIAVLVARLWPMVQIFGICARFSRLHSDLNPADLPTRGRKLPPSFPGHRRIFILSIDVRPPKGHVSRPFRPPNVSRLRRVRKKVRKSPPPGDSPRANFYVFSINIAAGPFAPRNPLT